MTGDNLSKRKTLAEMILQSRNENISDNDWHQVRTATSGKGAASKDPFYHDFDEENRVETSDADCIREQALVFPSPPYGARAPSVPSPGSAWSSQSGMQSKGQHRVSPGSGVSQSRGSTAPQGNATLPVSMSKQRSARSSSPPEPPSKSVSAPPAPRSVAQTRHETLSAIPKHMQQLQTGMSARASSGPKVVEKPVAPLAKMFVECCHCKFYHDLPSKVYECMAKPDAVVEDRMLGISGAITTAVKCPWCQHAMSTKCCAGYAAVVYLKEKLH